MPAPKNVVNAQNREAGIEADKIRSKDKESFAEAQHPGAERPAKQSPGNEIPGSDTEPENPIPTPEAGPEND